MKTENVATVKQTCIRVSRGNAHRVAKEAEAWVEVANDRGHYRAGVEANANLHEPKLWLLRANENLAGLLYSFDRKLCDQLYPTGGDTQQPRC